MKAARIISLTVAVALLSAWFPPRSKPEDVYQQLDTLAEILTVVQENAVTDIGSEEMIEGAVSGMLGQLDPHSNYYNEARYQTMKEDQHGAFYGIGVIVGYQNSRLTVVTALEGAPAARAGLRAGDVIVGIDEVETGNMNVNEAVRLLRGREGSSLDVTVTRPGLDAPLKVTMTREEIPTNNVRTSFMLDETIGYVALKDFGETAAQELSDAITALERSGMQRMVLDLRGNPGGLLPQAIGVTGLFIPGRKLVVSTQGRLRSANREYTSERKSPHEQIPLIVMIDRSSASASEIVAGALQDHDRALIVGVNSWGKGLVQSVFPLSGGTSGLALTTSRYFTPSGRNIQGDYNSWESYYSPESSESFFFGGERSGIPTFETTKGRKVYQVRGITPDVYIAENKAPEIIKDLTYKHAAFFNFATDHQDRYGLVDRDWRADERVVADFRAYVQAKGWLKDDRPFTENEAIKNRLTHQFLLITGGRKSEEWATRHLLRNDAQIQAAMDLFGKAGELLRVYKGEVGLRPNYTSELIQYAQLHRPAGVDKKAKGNK
ncbi:MAG: S41 family peptidase [Acidobacteriota bacterium]|nr:S41 family peptidase [Acidobacteriota bacterium]